ncbi:hypothetical protein PHET_03557 [Paragonimus heterotremus]|uniref:Thyrotropin-releasing hormone receptor n=1 Tax=Paragonimus heterotremus TaxID=100268 RepID=A0A8J4SR90_9TREM|nr:hypothetical protein PHET_03557 [Paragonimus heterotremus]
MFARLMVFLNSAVNPILYNMMSRKFRRALRHLLCRGQTSQITTPVDDIPNETQLQVFRRVIVTPCTS